MPAPDNTERQIGYLIEFFGKDKLITDITDDDVASLVAWRRGHRAPQGGAADLAVHRQRHHRAIEEAIHPRQGVGRRLRSRAAMAQALADRAAGARARAGRR